MKKYITLIVFAGLYCQLAWAQGSTCGTATILCNPNANFPAVTGVGSAGSFDCLGSTPNPSFFTFQISQSGTLSADLFSTPSIDIDFALTGPYANPTGNCSGSFGAGGVVDCSFSGASIEHVDIPSAVAGQWYILLVTNFNGSPTNITLSPDGGNTAVLGGPLAITSTGPFLTSDPAFTLTTSPPLSDPNVTGVVFSGPGITNASTGLFDPAVAGVGVHAINATGTSYACAVNTTANITVNAPPITASASNSGPVCTGESVTLTVESVGAVTYNWSGPGGFSSTSQTAFVSPAVAGTYFVTVTGEFANTAGSSTTVIVDPTYNPAFNLQTNACISDANITLALTTNPSPLPAGVTADDNQDWYGDGVTDAAGTGGTFSPSTAGAGVHTVCVDVGATTCMATFCQTITVYGAPSASATNTGPYCTGDPIQLNASGGASFSWNGPSGYTSTQQNPSNATLAGVYTVTVTQGNSCTSTASTTVIIYPTLDPTFAIPQAICENSSAWNAATVISTLASIALTNAVTIPTTPVNLQSLGFTAAGIIDWYGDGVTDNGATASFTPLLTSGSAQTGTYTICVDVGYNLACTQTHCQTILVTPQPNPTVVSRTVCVGSLPATVDLTVMFSNVLNNPTTPGGSWNLTGGSGTGSTNGDILTLTAAGTFNFTYLVTTEDNISNTCDASDVGTLTVQVQNPFFDAPSSFCLQNGTVNMTTFLPASSTSGGTWSMNTGAGFSNAVINTGGTFDPLVAFNANGSSNYVTIRYTVGSGAGCVYTHDEVMLITSDCDCPEIASLQLGSIAICSGSNFAAAAITDEALLGQTLNFAYMQLPSAVVDPYAGAFTSLGSATVVGTTPTASATYSLPANATCGPVEYRVVAYLTNTTIANLSLSAECRPVAVATITVWPNPATVAVPVVNTVDCVSTITVNCNGTGAQGFTVSPATYVANENDLATTIPVVISAGVGSPCADFSTTVAIPLCNIDCPDIYELEIADGYSAGDICSSSSDIDGNPGNDTYPFGLFVATEAELEGEIIDFYYSNAAFGVSPDPYTFIGTTPLTTIAPAVVANTLSGYRAATTGAVLPDNTTCDPITYYIYAIVRLPLVGLPSLPADCRPIAIKAVTVWPNPADPAFTPLQTTTDGCTSYFIYPDCPNWLVNPDGFTANIGDVNGNDIQDNIPVTVTVTVGGGVALQCEFNTTQFVPECWQGELSGTVFPITAGLSGGVRNGPILNPTTHTFTHGVCPTDGNSIALAFCDYLDHNFQPTFQGDDLLYDGVNADYLDCGQVEVHGIGGNPFDTGDLGGPGYDYTLYRELGGAFALFTPTDIVATVVYRDNVASAFPVNNLRAGTLNFFGMPDGYYQAVITDEDANSYNVFFYVHCNRPQLTTQPTMTHTNNFAPAGSTTYAPVPVPNAEVVVDAQRLCLLGDNTVELNATIADYDATTLLDPTTGALVNPDALCFDGGNYVGGSVNLIPAFLQATVQYVWSVSPNLDVVISDPNIANPVLTFSNTVTRSYEINVIAIDRFGCELTETLLLTVDPPVDADIDNRTICYDVDHQYDLTDMFALAGIGVASPGTPGQMVQGPTSTGGVFEVVSAFDHLGANVSGLTSITAGNTLFYPVAGIYTIRYYIDNTGNTSGLDNDCEDESTAILFIIPQPEITFDVIDALCLGADDYPRDLRPYYALAIPPGTVTIAPGDPVFSIAVASAANATINANGTGFQPTPGYYGPVEVCVTSSYTRNGVLCSDTKCDIIQILEPITHTRVCNCTGTPNFNLDVTLNGGLPELFATGPESFYNIEFIQGVTSPAIPPTNVVAGGTFTVTVVGGAPYIIRVTDGVGCEYFVSGTCGTDGPVDYLGLNGNYCFNDPPTTLYDYRFFDLEVGNEPPLVCDGFNQSELYTWAISTNFGPYVNGTDANGLDDDLTNPGQTVFIPHNAGPGIHAIRYCIDYSQCPDFNSALGQCIVCTEKVVYVYPEFDASFETNVPSVVCLTPATPINLVLDDIANVTSTFTTYEPIFDPNATNGVPDVQEYVLWSVDGSPLGTLADGSADYTPTEVGVHIIRVEVGYEDCVYEALRAVTVVESVNATLGADITICSNASEQFNLTQLYLPAITTQGGTWSVVGAAPAGTAVSGDVLSYDTNVIAASQTITVQYSVGNPLTGTTDPADGDCYGEDVVVITLLRTPDTRNFDLPDVACSGDANLVLATYLNPLAGATGVFTSTGILTAGDTEFDLTATGPGIYTVTYTETVGTAPNQCINSTTETITVLDGSGTVALTESSIDVCIGLIPYSLLGLEGISTPGGTWSGPGVVGDFLNVPVTGTYPITYCVNDAACQECQTLVVNVVPQVTAPPTLRSDNICLLPSDISSVYDFEQFDLSVLLDGATPGGTWTLSILPLGAIAVIEDDVLSYRIFDGGNEGNYTFVVSYTVGVDGAGGLCEDVTIAGDITVHFVNPEWDGPESICTSANQVEMTDYFMPDIFAPSGFIIGTTPNGTWLIQQSNGAPYTGTAFNTATGTWVVADETPGVYAVTWLLETIDDACFGVSHTELITIQACACPTIDDLQASVTDACGNGTDNTQINLVTNSGNLLDGIDITYGYSVSPNYINNPYALPAGLTQLGTGTVSLVGNAYQSQLNNVTLPAPNPALGECDPITYIVYAFVTDNDAINFGLLFDCTPIASTTVTIWPDPQNMTVTAVPTTNGLSCTYTMVASCEGYTVTPAVYTANPNDAATNIAVSITGGAGHPCADAVNLTAAIGACDACAIGFNAPDYLCAEVGATLSLDDYTTFTGGTWTVVTPGGGLIDGAASGLTGIYTPPLMAPGTSLIVEISYQLPAGTTCSITTESDFITLYAQPLATLDPVLTNQNTEFCLNSADLPFDLSILYNIGTTPGGIWTAAGPDAAAVSGTTFDPSLAGTYVLTYSVSNGSCADFDSYTVTVYPALNSTISGITICESPSGTINLAAMFNAATTPGGTWTVVAGGTTATVVSISNGVLTYTIPSGGTAPYTIQVTYTVQGVAGQPAPCATTTSAPTTITINGATQTGFDLPDTWCEDSGNINLSNYTAAGGGTWYLMSQNGVPSVPATGTVVPGGVVSVGTLAYVGGSSVLEIRYQPAAGGCGVPMTEFITVSEGVVATLTGTPDDLCIFTDTAFDLTDLYGPLTTTGGLWTATGPDGAAVILGNNVFDPFVPGWYQLEYTVTNGVCTASDNFFVYVHPELNADLLEGAQVCEDNNPTVNLADLLFVTNVTTPGGSWQIINDDDLGTGGGAIVVSNELYYFIDPTTSPVTGPPYIYNIQLQYIVSGDEGAPAPCDEAVSEIVVLTIFGGTETGFDLPDTWCQADGGLDLNLYVNLGGGEWDITSITTVGGATIDPALEPFTALTVSPIAVNGVVNVDALATLAGFGTNSVADSSIIEINYQPAAGGCGMPITEVFVLYEDVDAAWTNPSPVCAADLPINLSALVTGTQGGVFSGTGVYLDDNGTPADPSDDFWAWDPFASGLEQAGVFTVTYTVGFGLCEEFKANDIVIYPILTNVLTPEVTICESPSGTVNLSALLGPDTPDDGTWTVISDNLTITPIINNDVLTYFIVFSDVAPYTIQVQYTLDADVPFPLGTPCNPAPATAIINISGATETGFDLPDTWCEDDGPIDLTQFTIVGGGSYALTTDPEVSIGTTYTPIPDSTYLVGITYTPIPGGCGMPMTEFVQIIATYDAEWDNPIVLCQDQLPYQLEALTPGGIWSGPGVTPSGLFGEDPEYYVVDFSSGSIISNDPANVNHIYSYTEDGMVINTIAPATPSNYFQFIPNGAQTDVELSTNGGNTIGTLGTQFVYNGGAPFDMVSLVMSVGTAGTNGTNGGSVFEAYVGAAMVDAITIPNSGVVLVTFPATFQNITRLVWRLQSGDPRTRIEEFTFLDKSAPVPPGNYPITYTIGQAPCIQEVTHIIEVVPIRHTDINPITVCQSPSGTVNLSAMLTPITEAGGTWTVVGDNLAVTPTVTNNVLNYQISFIDVPPYQITIQYDIASIGGVFDPGPCNPLPSTAVITITNTTETGFDLPDTWCVTGGPINLANYTTVGGGTYSLVTSPEIPLAGNLFIPQNGQGLVGINYTPAPNGCGTPSTQFIQIIDQLNVDILEPGDPFCLNGPVVDLEASVTVSIPYPQGTVMTYILGTTITIPANTTVLYSAGSQVKYVNASTFIEGVSQSVAAGTIRSHGPGTPVTYPNATMVTLMNGSSITYTGVTVVNSSATGYWYGVGITNSLTGFFNPATAGAGTHIITYIVNNNGCPAQATEAIIVGDTVNPTFTTCPANVTVNTTSCSGFVSVFNPVVADNCNGINHVDFVAVHTVGVLPGGVPPGVGTTINAGVLFPIGFGANPLALFPSGAASGVYPVGTTTITWTVYDLAGNSNSCSTNVIVIDNQLPGIFCPPNVSVNAAPGQCSATVSTVAPYTADNCGVASVSFTAFNISDTGGDAVVPPIAVDPNGVAPNSGAPGSVNASGTYPGGVTVVTWTVMDASGNTATCSYTVTVVDNQVPQFVVCPQNITVNTAIGPPGQLFCSAIVTWDLPIVSDNCSASVSQAIINAYQQAQDDLEAAQDALLTASNNLQATINVLVAAQTNLAANPTNPILAAAVAAAQTNVNSAQAAFNLVFSMYTAALNNFMAAQAALNNAQNAADLVLTSNYQPGTEFPEGTTTVVYTVTDAAGNTATCSFTVTVVDNELPTLTCPPNVTAGSIFGQCYGYAVVGLPTNLSDNCGINQDPMNSYNWGHNASGIYPVGVTTVVWSIVDINGNTGTCSMTVTVNDVEPPTITCPEDPAIAALTSAYDYYVEATPGLCSAPLTIAPLIASDNCGIQSITNSFNNTANASGIYPVGTTVVVWTATDVNGNTSTCNTIVVVVDNQSPTIICQAPAPICTSDCTNDASSEFVTVPVPTYLENCSIVSMTNSYTGTGNASAVYPVGTTFIVWTIVDASGNPASCTVPVVVNKCCQAEAGTLTISGGQCPFDPVIGTAAGFATSVTVCSSTPDTYSHAYIVVNNATGLIVAISTSGNFTTLGSGLAAGNYTMYSYSARTTNPPVPAPAIGGTVSSIGSSSVGCYEITAGAGFVVPDAFPSEPLVSSPYQGDGIVPTFYNVTQLQVTGGTQPYNYSWTGLSGYVQYAVNQNPTNTGVIITVVYADNATWDLVVTDANGCTENSLHFDNVPDVDPSALVDIYDYTIASTPSGAASGSITIYVEGGTACGTGNNQYQYEWSGPSNWMSALPGPVTGGATFTLSNLPSGWYIVTVTDCSGQETIGWYWVPKQIRGRGKLADGQSMVAYPNPFDEQTTLEFAVAETGKATLVVYSIDGKEVGTLFKGEAMADEVYSVQFSAKNLPAGMYIAELTTANGSKEHYKLILSDK